MKIFIGAVLVTIGVTFVAAQCEFALGKRENGDVLLHTMRISQHFVEQPTVMSLLFEYMISPVDVYLHITRVDIAATLVGVDNNVCTATWPSSPSLPEGFNVRLTSVEPVQQMYGYADIYGIRKI